MAPETGRHGAFTSSEKMLETLQTLAVTLAETNVRLNSVIDTQEKTDAQVATQGKEIGELKAKLYTMSGIIGVGVSVATNWITGQINA